MPTVYRLVVGRLHSKGLDLTPKEAEVLDIGEILPVGRIHEMSIGRRPLC